ncbi:hypothetical protein HaLaN_17965 [Haematococcus lacustris]|uniref:Uncharacterized protein n=1 Tax=Haematococcus lacustris TaxID=44745 RepID=A0A699ZDK7_HAELA|nr:hypothetical protein HaLaN_17965 [Haematococcus lacustris]
MELVVVDPCVPDALFEEAVGAGQQHTARVLMLTCHCVLACRGEPVGAAGAQAGCSYEPDAGGWQARQQQLLHHCYRGA